MIPKIIHYSWLSDNPKPDYIKKFMGTWHNFLNDYEFVLWDMKKLKEAKSKFAEEAVSVGKWAFAADFIRFYAVFNYGGIWLDTDVEVFKSFDDFLNHEVFFGRESWIQNNNKRYPTAHTFGAIKGHPFIADCLEYYKKNNFIKSNIPNLKDEERFNMKICPEVMSEVAEKYGYSADRETDNYQVLNNDIHIYPSWYFCRPEYKPIEMVYSIHRCAASWRTDRLPNFSFSEPKKMTIKIRTKMFLSKIGLIK